MNEVAQRLLLKKREEARPGARVFLTDSELFMCAEMSLLLKRMTEISQRVYGTGGNVLDGEGK